MKTTKKPRKKGKYVIHSHHTALPARKDMMYFGSIDPGLGNFALRIERCSADKCKMLAFAKHILSADRVTSGLGSKSLLHTSIQDCLDGYKDYYPKLDVVIIEDQMYVNADMSALLTEIVCYFRYQYPHICVVTISAQLKSTLVLGGKDMSKSRFQTEEVDVALSLLQARGDTQSIEVIQEYAASCRLEKAANDKPHDLCVTVNQLEAFRRLMGYP